MREIARLFGWREVRGTRTEIGLWELSTMRLAKCTVGGVVAGKFADALQSALPRLSIGCSYSLES